MRIYLLLLTLLAMSSTMAAPNPPPLAAKAYLLKAFESNSILAEQGAHERIEPASLTKLMTAYLSFKALKNGYLHLTQVLPVSKKAWETGGSKMFVEPNKSVTVDELLHGMIIQSGNDASIVLAEGIAVSEQTFVELMNEEAARLGMKETHFTNANGLPDSNHYTTVYDLSLLASALLSDFPDQYKRYYSVKEYTYNKITQLNRNRLLWIDPSVDGIKTGHTESAGYCLIASAQRNGMRLISVVVDTPSKKARVIESQKLLNYGFQFYDTKVIYQGGQAISKFKLWKGQSDFLTATVSEDIVLSYPKGQYDKIKATTTSIQPLIAPITKGQAIGSIQLMMDGKVLLERELIASEDVAVTGLLGRLWDSLKLMSK